MKEFIQYARCTKFTKGQKDTNPFSEYELTAIECDVKQVKMEDEEEPEWIVYYKGNPISCGSTFKHAVALASYEFMNESRATQYHLSTVDQ